VNLGNPLRVVQYAEGWRVWCVQETPSGLRLASVIHEEMWPCDGDVLAECGAEGHVAPDVDCVCGVHAAREPAAIWSYLRGRDDARTVARVIGRVALWGRVVEHEHGWRGERAFALSLVSGDPALRRVVSSGADARRARLGHARERDRVRRGCS
jgi:hypothetical protein